MRTSLVALAAVLCLLLALPVSAAVLYDNGPVNGTIDAWTINFGYQVADSFTLSSASTVTGANLYVWLNAGDNFTLVDWSILTLPVGGTTIASGTAAVTSILDSSLPPNSYGYDVYFSTLSISPNVSLGAGTYFLMFQNAVSSTGGSVYWDENDGPSVAWHSLYGYLDPASGCGDIQSGYCSETFQVLGTVNDGAVPEPGSLALVGSGILLLAGLLRRKLS
jgi:hypothetical protein